MGDYGIKPEGFLLKTAPLIFESIGANLRASIGAEIETEEDTLTGHVAAAVSDEIAELWELGQAAYAARDPDQATGDALDGTSAISGTAREEPSPSTVTLTATGDPTTALAAGRIVRVAAVPTTRFVTLEDAVIAATDAWAPSTDYVVGDRVTNAGRVYVCRTAGESAGAGGPSTTDADITDGSAHWRYLGEGTADVDVDAECEDTGPIVANAFTLTDIVTPVSGWDNVTNLEDAELGTDVETDAALRVRREEELSAIGAGNVETMRARVAKVTGIKDVDVFENTSDVVDGSGRPAKSMHVIVNPGTATAADIAKAIFETKPGGIEMHGAQSLAVDDSRGHSHTMKWDHATEVDIWITAEVEVIAEDFPADGEDQIKLEIVTDGDGARIGRDVIAQRVKSLIWRVDGVYDIPSFDIGTSDPPSGEANIAIAANQASAWSTARITLTITSVTPG